MSSPPGYFRHPQHPVYCFPHHFSGLSSSELPSILSAEPSLLRSALSSEPSFLWSIFFGQFSLQGSSLFSSHLSLVCISHVFSFSFMVKKKKFPLSISQVFISWFLHYFSSRFPPTSFPCVSKVS